MPKTGPPFTANQYLVGGAVFVVLNVLVGNFRKEFLIGLALWIAMVLLAKLARR